MEYNNYDYICPNCGFESDPCDFPDLYYSDTATTELIKNQVKLQEELQDKGYNIVTCGLCGQVFIVKEDKYAKH